MRIVQAFGFLLLAGCAFPADVIRVGQDHYQVGATSITGLRTHTSLLEEATGKGTDYCNRQGQDFQLDGADESGIRVLTTTSAQITFHCVPRK
jgi:hypothetical protein